MTHPSSAFDEVIYALRPLGVRINIELDQYVLTYRCKRERRQERAETLADALALGRQMAAEYTPPKPIKRWRPRPSPHELMDRHNRQVAINKAAKAAQN